MSVTKETGHVKWFNDEKGFGFICQDNGKDDVFVHFKEIVSSSGRKTLQEGQQVRYKVSKTQKGLQAEEVEII